MASASQQGKSVAVKTSASPSPETLEVLSQAFSKFGPSDLTIRTSDDKEFHVHRRVICSKCKFFDKAVNGPFKEAASGVILMPNDPPAAIAALLQYLYMDNYWYYPVDEKSRSLDYLFHLEVFIVGIIYDVGFLQWHAHQGFMICFKLHGRPTLSKIPRMISKLYESTPESGRNSLRDWFIEYSTDKFEALLKYPEFLEVMIRFPDFHRPVAKAVKERSKLLHEGIADLQAAVDVPRQPKQMPPRWSLCPSCSKSRVFRGVCDMEKIYCTNCKRVHDAEEFLDNFDMAPMMPPTEEDIAREYS
ncbi:hypothetical protein IWZ00DRAFT_533926 [Phyllosticta capitalensis]